MTGITYKYTHEYLSMQTTNSLAVKTSKKSAVIIHVTQKKHLYTTPDH